jgi:hypothetical protein
MRTASEKGMGILWGTRVYAYTKVLLEMTGGLALLTLGLAVLVNPNDTLDIVIKHIFSYWGLAATGASLTLLGMRRVFGVFVLADEEYEFPDSADAFKFRDSIQGALMTLFGAGILFLTYLWRK